jgi:hypothetical protein
LNLRKTVTNVVVIVIESEEPYVVIFFWGKRFGMQTVRVPVGRVPQIKHTCEGRKIPFIKNACNNFDEKKKMKRIQKDRNKFNEVQQID